MPTRRFPFLTIITVFAIAFSTVARAGEISFEGLPGGFPSPGVDSLFGTTGPDEENLLAISVSPETDTVVPGRPFKLVLTLRHKPGVYSYWTNPGGPGMGTRVAWELPEGFSISGPAWPAPHRYENGGMVFYIHKGEISLVYTVTPPSMARAGSSFLLKGDVSTQVCTPRSCTPLRRPVEARVTAGERHGGTHPAATKAMAALPERPRGWLFEGFDNGEDLIITMRPTSDANPDPTDVYFFDAAVPPAVNSQLAQRLEKGEGVWELHLPRLPGESRAGQSLAGVIRSGNGWVRDETAATDFAVDIPILAMAAEQSSGSAGVLTGEGLLLLVFAFLGGLLLNVMPCVFPVIGLKIMGFARQAHKDRRAVFLHGLSYTAGVLLCFWALAFFVITMGRGWGAQLQSPIFLLLLCHVFMVMSLNMAGVFEVGASVAGSGGSLAGREGLKRSFFTGLLATLTSTPCSAPFLGTALAYALSLPPFLSLGVFTLMGLGFSFPYLALSLFPNWLKRLPKPGPWMDTFRQAMCFPLFATTAYLFWTMEAMMDEWRFLMLLFGLVLTAMACWFYGKYQHAAVTRPRKARPLLPCAAIALGIGLWLGWPKGADEMEWHAWSPEAVARLREEGRPVYVDFTARWCATCQVNKRVYGDEGVQALIREKNVALLKADWTQYDERITATLREEFNKAAVPVTVLYPPNGDRAVVLPDLLTSDNVRGALESLPQ